MAIRIKMAKCRSLQ